MRVLYAAFRSLSINISMYHPFRNFRDRLDDNMITRSLYLRTQWYELESTVNLERRDTVCTVCCVLRAVCCVVVGWQKKKKMNEVKDKRRCCTRTML